MKSILFSHPTGSTMARESLKALQDKAYLYAYFTSLGFSSQSWLYRYGLPSFIKRKLLNRTYALSPEALHTHFFPEALRLLCQQMGFSSFVEHEVGRFCADAIFQHHDNRVAEWIEKHATLPQARAVYGYEDSCLKTFQAAKKGGIQCIYELPIAYWQTAQAILKEEAKRYPEWEATLLGNRDSILKNERKTQELDLADLILCPSDFVKQSLPNAILDKTHVAVVPYGGPCIAPRKTVPPLSKKLRFLFVGSLSQRKGLADIFEAFKTLNRSDIELICLGAPLLPLSFYQKQYAHFQWERPRSNAAIIQIMKSCHVLILPSLVEGRAIVQLEALACGLPIIITEHTGGADLVNRHKTGLIVPIRSPNKIAEAITWFADHRHLLPELQEACIHKAQTHSWEGFRQSLIRAIDTQLN